MDLPKLDEGYRWNVALNSKYSEPRAYVVTLQKQDGHYQLMETRKEKYWLIFSRPVRVRVQGEPYWAYADDEITEDLTDEGLVKAAQTILDRQKLVMHAETRVGTYPPRANELPDD